MFCAVELLYRGSDLYPQIVQGVEKGVGIWMDSFPA